MLRLFILNNELRLPSFSMLATKTLDMRPLFKPQLNEI